MYAYYYDQAISATAPDPPPPGCEEYPYSTAGQNLCLQGSTRPIEQVAMTTAGTIDKTAAAALPAVPGSTSLSLPTAAQQTTAGTVVAQQWPSVSG